MSRTAYLTTKFGSPGRYEQIAQRVAKAAEAEGLIYNIAALRRQPNTLDCHRLILWAGRAGKAAQIKQRLMEIYFTEGGDLSDPRVLVEAASDCGLDPHEVSALLASDADVAAIEQAAKSAQEAGIDGVPFYVFGNVLAVSGAQSPEYLGERHGTRRRATRASAGRRHRSVNRKVTPPWRARRCARAAAGCRPRP